MGSSTFTAQRIRQGNSFAFLFSLPINTVLTILEIPDPNKPFPENRRVSRKHALDFGNYWEKHEGGWIVPPLLLDSSKSLKCKLLSKDLGSSELVELEMGDSQHYEIRILDGQHRILGWYLKSIDLDMRLSEITSNFNKALLNEEKMKSEILLSEIEHIRKTKERISNEHVTVYLIDSLSSKLHQQYFVDIAKNALGINKTVQAKFDNASVVNRVSIKIINSHSLLAGRVDLEKTSCSGENPNLLSVVNIADITRHACFGVNRRVTAAKEINYKDEELETNVIQFFDSVVKKIPVLAKIANGTLEPKKLRKDFMLGSGTIWRCLAGAFYETCVINDDDQGTIEIDPKQLVCFENFLELFSENMRLPISRQWFATTLFPTRKSKAPSSRAQDLSSMVDLMTAYSRNGQLFVPKNPSSL
jgi:hypothetical protein